MMSSWTTCFVAAIVLAVGGALWLGARAPSRPPAAAQVVVGQRHDAKTTAHSAAPQAVRWVGFVREMVPPK